MINATKWWLTILVKLETHRVVSKQIRIIRQIFLLAQFALKPYKHIKFCAVSENEIKISRQVERVGRVYTISC